VQGSGQASWLIVYTEGKKNRRKSGIMQILATRPNPKCVAHN